MATPRLSLLDEQGLVMQTPIRFKRKRSNLFWKRQFNWSNSNGKGNVNCKKFEFTGARPEQIYHTARDSFQQKRVSQSGENETQQKTSKREHHKNLSFC
jgi:hypothetical protein